MKKSYRYKKLREKLPAAIANGKKLGEVDFDNIESAKSEMYKLFHFLTLNSLRVSPVGRLIYGLRRLSFAHAGARLE